MSKLFKDGKRKQLSNLQNVHVLIILMNTIQRNNLHMPPRIQTNAI